MTAVAKKTCLCYEISICASNAAVSALSLRHIIALILDPWQRQVYLLLTFSFDFYCLVVLVQIFKWFVSPVCLFGLNLLCLFKL